MSRLLGSSLSSSNDEELAQAERDRVLRCTQAADVAYRVVLEEISGEVFLSAYRGAFAEAFAKQLAPESLDDHQ